MQNLWNRLRAAISMPVLFALLLAAAILLLMQAAPDERSMTRLEARVGEALSGIEGAGRVEVVIRTRTINGQGTALGGQSQMEEVPCGAIAIAQGADDPLVRIRLTEGLRALLGLPAADVEVLSANGGNP